MFLITNPKIAGFTPEWSHFRGYSILFDNPSDCLLPLDANEDLKLLSCDIESEQLGLYKSLNQTLTQLSEVKNTYLFCPLPSHSYHVTLWDGINDGNVQEVSREHRFNAEDLLDNLPHSLRGGERDFLRIGDGPLHIHMEESIDFQFDKLIKWGNSVLVASLKPANSRSRAVLHKIEEERKCLIEKYKERFGLETCGPSYTPHVSLGYFANKERAEMYTSNIGHWNERFLQRTEGQTVTFTSNSLYGFSSMATFYKKF
ncbi:hypothetical protein [Paenibacillus sp. PDC88]|uniref:hypothetical protein n=1 Tax=Paenibacillus sp. PDC88 TaxID=1884375 RepID=UPI0008954C79|nr:hypothetical protein [Paenibacillus sp. PDC88]SDX30375.1 hypothetical protein SAMN05518848_106100 [Paenibacillus sp. PDC88]